MPLLEVDDLRKSYNGTPAVDGLSFHVEAGEVFGLLGPNGAGKTTTMSVVCGLLSADSGSVRIDGKPLDAANRPLKALLGLVPQELAVYPDLTCLENLRFFGSLYGLPGGTLRQQMAVALERTGLTQHADKLVSTFSGGMKRRLTFAVGLVHRPKLLILDEPTVGVDPQSRSHLLECVREFSAQDIGIVYASHYMEEVEAICDRVAIIDQGRMLACGTLKDLLHTLDVQLQLVVARCPADLSIRLKGLAEVHSVEKGDAVVVVRAESSQDQPVLNQPLERVLRAIGETGAEIRSVVTAESNLERLFLNLTGRSLRD
jgi:ABC-2 type transport system ATP-binding protein